MTPNEGLIRLAQAGDRAAFGKLVHAEYGRIFRFALKFTGCREDAEDIAQQACIKLAESIRQFRFESALSTWLYTLVLNCARDWMRSQARHQSSDTVAPALVSTSSVEEQLVYLHEVLGRIDAMGGGFKETVVLVLGEGMSHAEAAALLGVRESTVSWRVHEVRKRLADLKAAEGSDER